MKNKPIRTLIVDDHFMVRVGLVSTLSQEADIEVVGEARHGAEAIELFAKLRPDITLMDGILPDIHGVEVTRRIIADYPDARIILVSINDTTEDVHRAVEAGAFGYLPKSSQENELLKAIRRVAEGKPFMPVELARKLTERKLYTPLSEREIEVLRLVAQGKANKEIAEVLGVGDGTIKTHVKHLLAKLGAPDRTRAVTRALEQGIFHI